MCFKSKTIMLERGLKRADNKLLSIGMQLKENKGIFKQITQSIVHVDNPHGLNKRKTSVLYTN